MFLGLLVLGAIGSAAADAAKPEGILEVFPVDFQKGRYSFIEGFPHVFYCSLKGDAKAMADARLILDLPDGFEYVGSSTRLPPRMFLGTNMPYGFVPDVFTVSQVERDGAAYKRYTITLDRSLTSRIQGIDQSVLWANYEHIYLRARPGAAPGCQLYLKACWNEGRESSGETRVTCDFLPALKPPSRRTERFELDIGMPLQTANPFPAVSDAYREYWTALSPRPWIYRRSGYSALSDDIRRLHGPPFRVIADIGGAFSTPGHLTRGFEGRYVGVLMDDGTFHHKDDGRTAICPSWLVDDPDGLFESMVTNDISGRLFRNVEPAEAIEWDLEPTTTYCYCPACLSNFAAFAGISNAPPAPAAVKPGGRLANRWFDFRVKQHAAIQARYYAVVKKHYPDIPFWICTDPLHSPPESILRDWCGVDERLTDDHCEMHTPMVYYAGLRFFEDVAFNRQHLKKPILVLNDPSEMMERYFTRYNPQSLKQNIVAAAALGCIGFGFWPDDAMDGRYLTQVRDAFALIGAVESYYSAKRNDAAAVVQPRNVAEKEIMSEDGKSLKIMVPPFNATLKSTVHQRGGDYLVSLFNYDAQADAVLSIQTPSFKAEPGTQAQIVDIETGQIYTDKDGAPLGAAEARSGFLTRVPKDGVVLLEIAANQHHPATGTVSQAVFEKILAERAATPGGPFPEKRAGQTAITWGTLAGSATPNLVLSACRPENAATNRIFIDALRKASVVAWKPGTAPAADYLAYGTRGRLGELVFNAEPKELNFQYVLRSIDIRAAMPEAVYTCRPEVSGADPATYALAGLEIEKKITLEENGRRLRVRFTFHNVSSPQTAIPLGFQIKNIPAFGGLAANPAKGVLSEDVAVKIRTPEGPLVLRPKGHNTLLLPMGSNRVPLHAEFAKMPDQPWIVSPITLEAKDGGKMILTPDPDATAGTYVWWDNRLFTIEFLSAERILAPQASAAYEFTVAIEK